jgi:hypothetical protein
MQFMQVTRDGKADERQTRQEEWGRASRGGVHIVRTPTLGTVWAVNIFNPA